MSTPAYRSSGMHVERPTVTYSGFVALLVGLALVIAGAWGFASGVVHLEMTWMTATITVALVVVGLFVLAGLYTLQPNEAAIMQLFG
ncbi:MAG: hypothetical protein ABI190_09100, partial [Casimicrobiaceae bacterium]